MSTPFIRFKGFSEDWEQCKVSEIGNIVTGSTPKTSVGDNYGGEFLFVSPADIQGNRYVDETITTLTKKGFEQGRKIRERASLFVSIGSTIGKVAQTSQDSTTNQQINAVEPFDNFDDDFVFTSLENISESIKAIASNQAVPIVNKTTFGEVEIEVPSALVEQQKIGAYFRNLDNLITLHQHKYDTLLQTKKSMLAKMFPKDGCDIPEIRFGGFTNPWEQRKLGEYFKKYQNTVYLQDEEDYRQISIRNTGIVEYRCTNKGKNIGRKRQYLIDTDTYPITLTFTRQTVYEGGIGFVPKELNGAIVTENMPLLEMTNADSDFMKALFNTSGYYKAVIDENTLIGSAQKALHEKQWLNSNIRIPSLDEQEQIGSLFFILDHLITLHQRKLSQLKQIKLSLLQKMFVQERSN